MKKVLLVSSSVTFLSRNVNLLMDKGFQLSTATSGTEAVKLHEKSPFDLVLSDMELDDMDGCELCSKLRQTVQPIPLSIVLICYENPEQLRKVSESHATAMLLRPLHPTQLLVTIGSFIGLQLARDIRVAYTAEIPTKKQDLEFVAVSHDISISGILLETDQELVQGERIICSLRFNSGLGTDAEGEIMRSFNAESGRNFYGVKFVQLPPTKRYIIEQYVASNHHLGISQKPTARMVSSVQG